MMRDYHTERDELNKREFIEQKPLWDWAMERDRLFRDHYMADDHQGGGSNTRWWRRARRRSKNTWRQSHWLGPSWWTTGSGRHGQESAAALEEQPPRTDVNGTKDTRQANPGEGNDANQKCRNSSRKAQTQEHRHQATTATPQTTNKHSR